MSLDVQRRGWDIADRVRDFARGLWYGYPLCCVLRFSIDPHYEQCVLRGRVPDQHRRRKPWRFTVVWDELYNPTYSYVPCGIFHHGEPCGPSKPVTIADLPWPKSGYDWQSLDYDDD